MEKEAQGEEKEAPQPDANGQAEEVARLKDQLLRLQADFENARKRWRNEQAQIQERANADVLRELLEITDDFQRALAAGRTVHPEALEGGTVNARSSTGSGRTEFIAGVEMISRRLEGFLKSYGIAPIEAEGKLFDPALHEAVAHEVTESVPEGTVLSELRKGYTMNGRVLRTAVVKVASHSKEETEDGTRNRN